MLVAEYFFARPRSLIVVPVASGVVCSNYSCRWPQEQQLLSLAQGYCCDTGSLTHFFVLLIVVSDGCHIRAP